ncbi:MAG: hypothetical protein ACOYL5_11335 [Phototrophicaceae bacterium]|jgi:hypothetical protein
MADRAQLEAIRELIRQKRYDQARAQLLPLQGDATADKWLNQLEKLAPPPPLAAPPPKPMTQTASPVSAAGNAYTREEVDMLVQQAIKKRDEQGKIWRQLGCAFRIASLALFLTCSCGTIVPTLLFFSASSGNPRAQALVTQVEAFQESPIGRPITNVTTRITSGVAGTVGEQIEPQLVQVCEQTRASQGLQADICSGTVSSALTCLESGTTNQTELFACLNQVAVDQCVAQAAQQGIPNARAQCEALVEQESPF